MADDGDVRAVVPLVDAGAKLIVTSGHHTAANHLSRALKVRRDGRWAEETKAEKVMLCEPGEGERSAHHDGAVAGGHVALMSLL